MNSIHPTSPAWKLLRDRLTIADRDGFEIAATHASVASLGIDQAKSNARRIAATPQLRSASEDLYNAIMAYVFDIPDSELPEDLVEAFDAIEAAWHLSDGTKRER